MAAVRDSRKKKRKKNESGRKLTVGEKVEVRSFEEGLKGSWHGAVVVGLKNLIRIVEYADLLDDSSSKKLRESISVLDVLEGAGHWIPRDYRGHIRPLPPCSNIQEHEIKYGLCVDAFVDDAWWEGVVFDRMGGSKERLVFFPDQGDQQKVDVDRLRITQDWDEASGDWRARGEWLFLKLVENFEREGGLPVSVRQIWWDVRSCVDFRDRCLEWMSGFKSLWEKLVLDAVEENRAAAGNQTCDTLDNLVGEETVILSNNQTEACDVQYLGYGFSWDSQNKECAQQHVPQKLNNGATQCNSISHRKPHAAKIQDNLSANGEKDRDAADEELSAMQSSKKRKITRSQFAVTAAVSESQVEYDVQHMSHKSDDCAGQVRMNGSSGGKNKAAKASRKIWISVKSPRPEYSPQAILDYCALHSENHKHDKSKDIVGVRAQAKSKVLMHLSYEGWNIESDSTTGIRKRYFSPSGEHYNSLIKVCRALKDKKQRVQSCRNSKGIAGNHLGCKPVEPSLILVHAEKPTFTKDLLGCSMLKENVKPQEENSSCLLQYPNTTQDSRNNEICIEACHLSTEILGSDGKPDSSVGKISLSEILKEQQHTVGDYSPLCREDQVLDLSEPERLDSFSDHEVECCPQAVIDYSRYVSRHPKQAIKEIGSRAKKHLAYDGWRIFSVNLNCGRCEARYRSPEGKCFYSLASACKEWIKEQEMPDITNKSSTECALAIKKFRGLSNNKHLKVPSNSNKFNNYVKKNYSYRSDNHASVVTCAESDKSSPLVLRLSGAGSTCSSSSCDLREVGLDKVQVGGVRTSRKRRDSFLSPLLHPKTSQCLLARPVVVEKARPDGLAVATVCDRKRRRPRDWSVQTRVRKKRKALRPLFTCKSNSFPHNRVLRSSKKGPQILVSCSNQTPRTVLSWLIENDVLLPRQKVSYIRKRDSCVMAKGQITRAGIKCGCCKKVYSLARFEVHAGSSSQKPAANIFLQDGRSLLQCQTQLVRDKHRVLKPDSYGRMKSCQSHFKSDSICSICHYGGILVLCDNCPSSFHLSCIGLQVVPEGKWFCPSCQCRLCGQSEFSDVVEQSMASVQWCDQCECKYHVGCLRKRGSTMLKRCLQGNWFCSKKCSEIFIRLQQFVEKSKPTAVKGLSWKILRSCRGKIHDFNGPDFEAITENHSKLWVALSVLHECFSPIHEPRTRSDILVDVVFNNWSELKRLNFRGFYTMLLERDDELISVATVRIYGEKVAEVPLVGTRVHYRRQGMCRLLLDELEKMLSDIGVERLLLPAVPQLLETWTTSFGFTKLTNSERLQHSEYTLLDFPDTTMCQKLLMPSMRKGIELRGEKNKVQDRFIRSNRVMNHDISDAISMEPIKALFSGNDQAHVYPLHSDLVTGKELSAHSSLSSNYCLNSELLMQETEQSKTTGPLLPIEEQINQNEITAQMPLRVAAPEESNVCGLIEKCYPSIMRRQMDEIKCKFGGICYERNSKMNSSKESVFKNIDRTNNPNLHDYCYKHSEQHIKLAL